MISKGDLITSSKPFAFALCSEEKNKRCDQCFKLIKVKMPCYKCFNVNYCSRKCQSESLMEQNHCYECPILATRPLSNMTRIIARVINKIELNDSNQVEVIGNHRRDWNCLMDHYNEIVRDVSVMYQFNGIFSDLELIFADKLPDVRSVISIYGKILINSFAVQDQFMRQIGRAVYLGPSIFDHSCKPSANFIFIGTTIFIKAIKDIHINDIKDLRISYIDEFETKSERLRHLKDSYYFECDCERCGSNSQQFSLIETNEDDSLRSICDKLDSLSDNGHNPYQLESYGHTLKDMPLYENAMINENNLMIELVSRLRQKVIQLKSVLEVKIAEFIAFEDKDINLLLKIIDIYRSYYGECHQILALKLYFAAKIADKYPNLKRQLLNEARSIAYLITPNFKQISAYPNCSDDQRFRTINKYNAQGVLEDLLSNSTLLYLIESELKMGLNLNDYRINNSNPYLGHKQKEFDIFKINSNC